MYTSSLFKLRIRFRSVLLSTIVIVVPSFSGVDMDQNVNHALSSFHHHPVKNSYIDLLLWLESITMDLHSQYFGTKRRRRHYCSRFKEIVFITKQRRYNLINLHTRKVQWSTNLSLTLPGWFFFICLSWLYFLVSPTTSLVILGDMKTLWNEKYPKQWNNSNKSWEYKKETRKIKTSCTNTQT